MMNVNQLLSGNLQFQNYFYQLYLNDQSFQVIASKPSLSQQTSFCLLTKELLLFNYRYCMHKSLPRKLVLS